MVNPQIINIIKMKTKLLLLVFVCLFSTTQAQVPTAIDSVAQKDCPCSRIHKKHYKKTGVKRTKGGATVWVILDIVKQIIPFFHLV